MRTLAYILEYLAYNVCYSVIVTYLKICLYFKRDLTTIPKLPLTAITVCLAFTICFGYLSDDFISQKINAGNTDYQEWNTVSSTETPWLLKLYWKNDNVCVGTILSAEFALFLAQCIHKVPIEELSIHTAPYTGEKGTVYSLKSAKVHPQFFDEDMLYNWHFDIAVIKVESKFSLDNSLTKAISLDTKFPSANNVGSGFGWSAINSPTTQLRKVNLAVVEENSDCLYDPGHLFCAGAVDKDASCFLDWGAPFIQHSQLVGLASIYEGCRQFNTYVFVGQPSNLDFINTAMSEK